jgi:hypothetical protein
MPIGYGKFEMFFEGLSSNNFIFVIVFECKWVFGSFTFKLDFIDVWKIGF